MYVEKHLGKHDDNHHHQRKLKLLQYSTHSLVAVHKKHGAAAKDLPAKKRCKAFIHICLSHPPRLLFYCSHAASLLSPCRAEHAAERTPLTRSNGEISPEKSRRDLARPALVEATVAAVAAGTQLKYQPMQYRQQATSPARTRVDALYMYRKKRFSYPESTMARRHHTKDNATIHTSYLLTNQVLPAKRTGQSQNYGWV